MPSNGKGHDRTKTLKMSEVYDTIRVMLIFYGSKTKASLDRRTITIVLDEPKCQTIMTDPSTAVDDTVYFLKYIEKLPGIPND